MESIKATYDVMRSTANEVDNLASDYETQYQNLVNEVENLTSLHYQGIDADAFREKVEEFKLDFMKMKNLMNDYATFLRDTATQYENTQRNRLQQAQQLGTKH